MGEPFWVGILEKVGFPIFVTFFLLMRTDKRLDKIVELQNEIIQNILKSRNDD